MRSTDLGHVDVERESGQEIPFHASGELTDDRPADGRYPIFEGGDIFEVWASASAPNEVGAYITLYRYAASNPTTGFLIATLYLPPYTWVKSYALDLPVGRGDQLAMGLFLAGTPTTPGRGHLFVVRIT